MNRRLTVKYLIPAIILILTGITLCFCFGCSIFEDEVSPGQTWIYIPNRNNPNPYEPETRYENKVLEIKNGWVKYQSYRYENNKFVNSTIKSDVVYWFLIDSKLEKNKKEMVINSVHVYEILPDGTKKGIVILPSEGWEAKEEEKKP